MAKSFWGYTDQQASAIHQALIDANLKHADSWSKIIRAITDAITIVVNPEVSCSEKVLYASEADRRFTNFVKALDATVQAHHAIGEALQWHVDNQLPSVPLLRDATWEEWRTTVRCLLSSDQFSGALNAVRIATDLATKQHNPYVTIQKTGAPKDYKVRG